MEELDEIYMWLRATVLPDDQVPVNWRWRMVKLLTDFDKRLLELEAQANGRNDDRTP